MSTVARMVTTPRLLARTIWATILLAVPGRVLRVAGGVDGTGPRRVVRVLGTRHLLEAFLEARGGVAARRLGGAADLLHALSAVGFAVWDGRWRRPASIDAAVELGFAATARRWRSG